MGDELYSLARSKRKFHAVDCFSGGDETELQGPALTSTSSLKSGVTKTKRKAIETRVTVKVSNIVIEKIYFSS